MIEWNKPTCDMCKRSIDSPEKALVHLKLYGSGFFHVECYVKGVRGGKQNPLARLAVSLLGSRSPAAAMTGKKKMAEMDRLFDGKADRKKLQAFTTKTSNDMLLSGFGILFLIIAVYLFPPHNAVRPAGLERTLVDAITVFMLVLAPLFIYASVDYRLRLARHGKIMLGMKR